MTSPPAPLATIEAADAALTAGLARMLAPRLAPGDTLLLDGPVGAGKTHFARALIRARQGDAAEDVPSPTFTLVQTYLDAAGIELWHADLYRLTDPAELFELGLEDAMPEAITLIEWPERMGAPPSGALRIALSATDPATDPDLRRITLSGDPARWGWVARLAAAARFVHAAGWAEARVAPLAGDASARSYARLTAPEGTAVLMDDPGGQLPRYLQMTDWLRDRGFAAPAVLAADPAQGFALLEDLGDDLLARVLDRDPGAAEALYDRVTDLIVDLHRHAPPDFVAPLDGAALAGQVGLLAEWYAPAAGAPGAGAEAGAAIAALWDRLAADTPAVVSLRDFHAENLVWRGDGPLGLLDFQDAVATHPAYELASALQDARRDIPPATEARQIDRYLAATGHDPDRFRAAYALMGAARGLRIMGIFARLALRDGKPRYLDLMPRVWAAVARDLAHPALAPLAEAVAGVPAPTPEVIAALRARTGRAAEAPTTLMLFAAGKGTRMAPLTDHTPKPLIPVAGRALLDHALDLATAAGVARVVVNTHHLGDQIARHLAGRPGVVISDEADLLRETGGGLRHALPRLGPGPVLTMNPDVIWRGPNPLAALRAGWDGDRMEALLMLVPAARTRGRVGPGDFSLDADGRLRRGGPLVYGGAQVIATDRLAGVAAEVFSLNLIWDAMIAAGGAFGLVHPGDWCDVGRPDCIPLAEAMLAEAMREGRT